MPKQTTESTIESRATWEHLEAWVRSKMREWVQELLDAEVDELLGRRKSERGSWHIFPVKSKMV